MRQILFLLAIALLSLPAHAWTRVADERIAMKAGKLAPADLRTIIDRFEDDFRDGIQQARAGEGSDSHRFLVLSQDGRLRDSIERETGAAISSIRTGRPMPDVVRRLGMLAHYVSDANNPFHVSAGDPRLDLSKTDFERYFERTLPKFPTVFYGLDRNFRLHAYFDRTFARTARFYPLMSEEYFRFGERRTSSEFDDRSTAFGVASVCYSHAVSDLVNLYFYIWKEAGGDVRSASVMRGGNLLLHDAN